MLSVEVPQKKCWLLPVACVRAITNPSVEVLALRMVSRNVNIENMSGAI